MEGSEYDVIRNDWKYGFLSAAALGIMIVGAAYAIILENNSLNRGFIPARDDKAYSITNATQLPDISAISSEKIEAVTTSSAERKVKQYNAPAIAARKEQVITDQQPTIVEQKKPEFIIEIPRTYTGPAEYQIRVVDGNDTDAVTPPVFLGFED
jgi:hypothetical protein